MAAEPGLPFELRLIDVQTRLNAPKSRKNTFGNYTYRSAEDILEAVKPLLAEHGLLLTISDWMTEVGGRVYVKATATVSHGEDSRTVTAFAREEETKKGMDAAQITGSASSYARKYALNGLFCIDDDKDPDTDEHHRQTHDATVRATIAPERTKPSHEGNQTNGATPHAQQPITHRQKQLIFALANEIAEPNRWPSDWVKDDLYTYFAVDSTTKLTTAQGAHAIRALQQVRTTGQPFSDALAATKGA